MNRLRLFSVLLWLVGLICMVTSLSSKARVGQFFSYPITLQKQSVVPSRPLSLEPFESGGAALPAWLSLWQKDQSHSAYLYGTPATENEGKLNIQIVGVDPESYQTVREDLVIELYDKSVELLYFVELPLLNTTLEDLLSDDTLSTLTIIVRRLWTRGEVILTSVTPSSAHVGSGVTVKFGGSKHFSAQLRLLSTHPSSEVCQTTGDPKVAVEKDFAPRFQVNWCRVVLTDLSRNPPTEDPVMDAGGGSMWRPVEYSPPALVSGRAHSLSTDFLACVLIPSAILVLLLLVLACVMCCGRTGWEKRVRMTPEPQLVRYNSIRRASISLRQLSENRELQLSTSSRTNSMNMGLDKEGRADGKPEPRSAPGTLQRRREGSPNPPPPYRPPMAYSTGTQ